jgi:protein gp37
VNKTPIEWCRTYKPDGTFEEGHTVNPIRFRPYGSERTTTMCMKVSAGCKNCYAESITRRFWPKDATVRFAGYTAKGMTNGEFILDEKQLLSVLKRRKPTKIFWGDMTDLFQDGIPDEFLDKCFAVCALTPHITHMFLTKRPERMGRYIVRAAEIIKEDLFESPIARAMVAISKSRGDIFPGNAALELCNTGWPLPNVWLGTSCEDQAAADKRVPFLLQTPAAVRFVSAEPLLGEICFKRIRMPEPLFGWYDVDVFTGDIYRHAQKVGFGHPRIDWLIVGGESGSGSRPMHPDWARSLRDECKGAGASFFFKQWGEWAIDHEAPNCEDWSPGHALVNRLNGDIRGSESLSDETTVSMWKAGKKAGGAILDGREWRQFPEVRR